jgi:biopolymer transport protein ExbD
MEPVVVKLSAAQRAKVRRLSQPKELSPDEEGGELNIVPFLDIIVNILIFVLATVAVTFTATIDTTPPASGGKGGVRAKVDSSALNLTVIIVNDGFSLKASGGNVGTGCRTRGAGLAIPKRGGRYDYPALKRCVAELKKQNPDFADETQIFIGANPGVSYQTIISVIDAVRNAPSGEVLFDDVNFKVPR